MHTRKYSQDAIGWGNVGWCRGVRIATLVAAASLVRYPGPAAGAWHWRPAPKGEPAEIIAKVLSSHISSPAKHVLAMRYVVNVVFSDSNSVKAGRNITLLGDQWPSPGGIFGGSGHAVMLGRSDPVMLKGTVFTDTVFRTRKKGVYRLWGGQQVLPIGLAIPSLISVTRWVPTVLPSG